MADETLTLLHHDTHAIEVRDAQSAADEAGKSGGPASPPGADMIADQEVLRGLVAAYGAHGVRRMIDSLKL